MAGMLRTAAIILANEALSKRDNRLHQPGMPPATIPGRKPSRFAPVVDVKIIHGIRVSTR
jgi:hypothetical protein